MTPNETTIVKALIAVAWADGAVQGPEAGVIEGMCSGFDASDDEEKALVAWASTARTLDEVDTSTLEEDDRDTLLGNAALLVISDGDEWSDEDAVLQKLARRLGYSAEQLAEIVETSRKGLAHART